MRLPQAIQTRAMPLHKTHNETAGSKLKDGVGIDNSDFDNK